MQCGTFPFKYLGAIISVGRVRVRDQLEIIEKVRNKLSGWRADSLSLAGRLVLAQSVLQALPVHVFQSGWTAKIITNKL